MKKIRRTLSNKSGLLLPVRRFKNKIRNMFNIKRVTIGAGVYLTSVLEYLVAEILELSGNACRDNKFSRISPRHVFLAIETDEELHKLLKKVIIPGSGVLPMALKKIKPIKSQSDNNISKSDSRKNIGNNVTILSEKLFKTGQKINVIQSDIVNIEADAYIHPTNGTYYLGGQVGQSILRNGGNHIKEIVSELYKSRGVLQAGAVEISESSDNMLCKKLIHVNSPSWNFENQAFCIDLLSKTILNILSFANANNINSLAIPSISSGSNGFPKQVAAETILRTINNFFRNNSGSTTIKVVNFVLYDQESVSVYLSELAKIETN